MNKLLGNCVKNLEKEMKKVHSLDRSINDNQSKGEKQLTDLSKVVEV